MGMSACGKCLLDRGCGKVWFGVDMFGGGAGRCL